MGVLGADADKRDQQVVPGEHELEDGQSGDRRHGHPVTIGVSNLVSSLGGGWQYLGAAAFVTMALPLAAFLALQRYFVRGIVGGAVKG
jgi:hypothetical protein